MTVEELHEESARRWYAYKEAEKAWLTANSAWKEKKDELEKAMLLAQMREQILAELAAGKEAA